MSLSHFHFLTPIWFLALIPAVLLLWGLWKQQRSEGNWSQVIDPEFQPVLLEEAQAQSQNALPFLGLALIWLWAITALAGPTWKQVKIPANETETGSVIILDLSLSMLAQDLKPNRLTQARLTLLDLLNQHPEVPMGLVAYAGSAHALVPVSKDNATLKALLPYLNPLMMPRYGSDPVAAFKKALQLLKGAHIKQGHLIWVTDDLDPEQAKALQNLLHNAQVSLSILRVGTQAGGPIPIPQQGVLKEDQGQVVIAKVPVARLTAFAQATHAHLTPITLDNSDIEQLLPSGLNFAKQKPEAKSKQVIQWLNMGPYLLWLLIPLLAVGFRRGWLSR